MSIGLLDTVLRVLRHYNCINSLTTIEATIAVLFAGPSRHVLTWGMCSGLPHVTKILLEKKNTRIFKIA